LINEDSIAIRHEPEIKGGLKELQKKGRLHITRSEKDDGNERMPTL
jgi:hypothetical protein